MATGTSVAAFSWSRELDESPALVWLKDLEGRYLQVNRRYGEVLATNPERLIGHTDQQLPPAEVVDGPRLAGGGAPDGDSLQLEYTVDAFAGRPALAVLRFPVRDADGEPIATCGVAAPLTDAHVARSECARLMRLERTTEAPGVLVLVPPPEPTPVDQGESGEADSREAEIEGLRKELGEGERRLAALHEASATAARRAHELMSALTQEQERSAELERALHRDARADRAEIERMRLERDGERAQAEELRQELAAYHRLQEARQWSAASQRALSAVLCGASEWRTGLKDAIRVLGTHGHWDAVTVWAPAERSSLRSIATWTADPDRRAKFETLTWQHPESLTATELGRAYTCTEPVVIDRLESSHDHRLKMAAAEGMQTAILVAIRDGVETLAMIEILSQSEEQPSPDLLVALEAVALQLGHFAHLLRLNARPHWRFGRV